ncbi:MAG: hypothetical protein IPF68_11625 [Bacteroidales bacterium]|nr:hypothetical protein [Bacteroidales bacterium]
MAFIFPESSFQEQRLLHYRRPGYGYRVEHFGVICFIKLIRNNSLENSDNGQRQHYPEHKLGKSHQAMPDNLSHHQLEGFY